MEHGKRHRASSQTIYVNCKTTSKCQTGKSWKYAYSSLQTALDEAVDAISRVYILIAAGTYIPSAMYTPNGVPGGVNAFVDERMHTFYIPTNTYLIGGFDGTESSIKESKPDVNETTLDGVNYFWHVVIIGDDGDFTHNQSTVRISNLTIKGGNSQEGKNKDPYPGVAALAPTQLADSGSGLYISRGCNVKLYNVIIRDNSAGVSLTDKFRNSGWGAGLYCYNSNLEATNCTFKCNSSRNEGGAVNVLFSNQGETHTHCLFDSCVFNDNTSGFYGGAVAVRGALINLQSNVIFKACKFDSNTSRIAGACYVSGLETKFVSCVFAENVAVTSAGAISTNNAVAAMVAKRDGTLIVRSSVDIEKCIFKKNISIGNYAYEYGTENTLPIGAGAISSYVEGVVNISYSEFLGNVAQRGNGGAIVNGGAYTGMSYGQPIKSQASTMNISESSFANNKALFGNGGAIASIGDKTVFLTIDDVKFVNNEAPNVMNDNVYIRVTK